MIHQYKLNGYNIVLDTYSGSLHSVDDLAYDIIARFMDESKQQITAAMLQKYPDVPAADIEETYADVQQLQNDRKLFSEDAYKDLSFNLKKRKTYVKALCLNVAHTCNLTCDYCFAAQGKYHGERAVMSFDVGRRAIDFLLEACGHHRHLDVDFFGGEPLMNWKVVKQIVAYARSKEAETGKIFRFTLTTNGLLLTDDVIDFLNQEMHNVVLSLDGRRSVHNRLRKTITGKGSYDYVVPRFQNFVKKRGDKEYYVRGTFTHNNVDFTNDIFHMADLGFGRLSMEPVISDPSEPYALQPEDLPEIYRQYELLAKEMLRREQLGNGFLFYHFMIDLNEGPCIQKRISGCGSGTQYLAVTPWGELFPCHQFVGDTDYSMGNIWDGITRSDLQDAFKESNCYSKPECENCWAKLYCSGGCPANSLHAAGSINGNFKFSCDIFRKRIECALMIKVAEAMRAQQAAN
ncbi:MAG: thioether cross-link-forming SCIFF peptide maturase [Sporolactobacillus sp.]